MRVLITGVTGQDGSYLAQQLAGQGHDLYGMVRGQPNAKRAWIAELVPTLKLVEGDMLDQSSLQEALKFARPDVVFNLAALTYVGMSWQQPAVMSETTGLGCMRLLEAIRHVDKDIRMVQASSSEMFGGRNEAAGTEHTPLRPRSPYGIAKAFAHNSVITYRESFGMHASTAIMFNHESPRRGTEFVTRKVTNAVARIAAGKQKTLELGRTDTFRDWGWAPEYMQALPLIAAREVPDDFVIATGEAHSVGELTDLAFSVAGLDAARYLAHSDAMMRPADVNYLRGDARKARELLGWEPQVKFAEIVRMMVAADLDAEGIR